MAQAPKIEQPPLGGILKFVGIMWLVLMPVGVLLWAATLPARIFRWVADFAAGKEPEKPMRMTCQEFRAKKKTHDTLMFVHGFPDTGEMFVPYAKHYSALGYDCLVVYLPGFVDGKGVGGGIDASTMAGELKGIIEEYVRDDSKVTYIGHDFGCMYGSVFQFLYPELVSRMVYLDVSGAMPTQVLKFTLYATAYQVYLAVAFALGGAGGDFLLRASTVGMAGYSLRPWNDLKSTMCFGYFNWFAAMFRFSQPEWKALTGFFPHVTNGIPVFFAYGTKREGVVNFASEKWIETLWDKPTCEVKSYPCGHWVPVDAQKALTQDMDAWLGKTNAVIDAAEEY